MNKNIIAKLVSHYACKIIKLTRFRDSHCFQFQFLHRRNPVQIRINRYVSSNRSARSKQRKLKEHSNNVRHLLWGRLKTNWETCTQQNIAAYIQRKQIHEHTHRKYDINAVLFWCSIKLLSVILLVYSYSSLVYYVVVWHRLSVLVNLSNQ